MPLGTVTQEGVQYTQCVSGLINELLIEGILTMILWDLVDFMK